MINEMKHFAIYETPVGWMKIVYDNEKVTELKKMHDENIDDFGTPTAFTDGVFLQLMEYFEGKRKSFDVTYELHGTEFQKKVWKALCDIPYGETRSYKEVAIAVGNDKASRAVGMANNKNPVGIIVPCHRVIGASGKLVGYAGGLEMKQFLLELERGNKFLD